MATPPTPRSDADEFGSASALRAGGKLPSAGDLEIAIHRALEARDMPAVVGLLRLLVAVDVRRAAAVYDLIQIALEIREAEVV